MSTESITKEFYMEKTTYDLVVEYVEKHAPAGITQEEKEKQIRTRTLMFIRV